MIYKIEFTIDALSEIAILKKSEVAAYNKLQKLLLELMEHPYTGTGKPKQLKGDLSGCYSRRITQKHRLVYSVDNEKVIVLILSASGHYEDK